MSGMLLLLSNYYKSVIESEKIYNDYLLNLKQKEEQTNQTEKEKLTSPISNDLVTLQLQTQVNKLNSQLQTLNKQNDKLKELNKTQRITSDEKIKILQSKVKDLNDKFIEINSIENNILATPKRGGTDNVNIDNNKEISNFHLLSPLGKNIPNGSRGSSHTIFDDSTSESELEDTQLNLDNEGVLSNNNHNSNEKDTFILSLKKYDQVKSNVNLEKVLNESSEISQIDESKQVKQLKQSNKKLNNNNNNTQTKPQNKRNKRKLKDKRRKNAIKKLNELDIPKLNKNDDPVSSDSQTSNKKRKLSNKKIQVTSDNEELLPILSQ